MDTGTGRETPELTNVGYESFNTNPLTMPDWTLWADIPTAEISEAVALSLNVNPLFSEMLWGMFNEQDPAELDQGTSEFARRLVIARANIQPFGTLPVLGMEDDPPRCIVRLADFSVFAKRLGWPLPNSFPDGRESIASDTNTTNSETPEQRRSRLAKRRDELKSAGVKAWKMQIAQEEGVSAVRVGQILAAYNKENSSTAATSTSLFGQLTSISKRR